MEHYYTKQVIGTHNEGRKTYSQKGGEIMKNDVWCLMLSQNTGVVMYGPKKVSRKKPVSEAESIEDKEQEEYLKNLKKYRARKKRECKKLQGVAEFIESKGDAEQIKYYGQICNGAIKHLAFFKYLIAWGEKNNKSISLSSFRKQIKEGAVAKEWQKIRQWCSRQKSNGNEEMAVAITIGRTNRGWYSLRVVIVGDNSPVSLFSYKLGLFLCSKNKWTTRAMHIGEESKELLKHYKTEELEYFNDELFSVFRATLTLPFQTRTYRNEEAERIINKGLIPVSYGASVVLKGPMAYNNSVSGVALCEIEQKRGRVVRAEWIAERRGIINGDDDSFEYAL